jgi:polyhydroxyalkanoate synthesis regulator phasin
MPNTKDELAEMKRKLRELIRARSKATCSSVISTEIDVRRETEIEDLEEQIQEIEKKIKTK